jgi:glycosyltransferase involved in cell wall biosynthesis
MAHPASGAGGAGDTAPVVPTFAVTMTVRNNIGTIAESLATILPLRPAGGELVIVDAESTDGTKEFLDRTSQTSPELTVVSRRCNRGIGRNLAVATSRAPIVLTQVDGDNRYAPGVFVTVAERLRSRPHVGLIFTVGAADQDPSSTRFYAWRREAFDRAGGYPDTQEREDPPLLLRAFRAGFGVERCLLPRVAEDLKPRPAGFAPNVPPWRRSSHTMWAARKFRVMGYRYREYARLLSLTRRTTARFVAGLTLGALAYVQGAVHGDGRDVLERNDAASTAPMPPRVPASGARGPR